MPAPASHPSPRALTMGAALAAIAHAAWIMWRIAHGVYFVTDDDPYRLYHGHLAASGSPTIFSPLWPPGHALAIALLERVGVPLAYAGFVLGVMCTVATVFSLASIARSLGGFESRTSGAATASIALATPWLLHVSYGGLAEPLAMTLAAGAGALALRRIDGASRRALAGASMALLAATWVRYETWWFVPFLAIGAPLARRAAGDSTRSVVIDASIAAIPCLGPVAWLIGERLAFGDAFVFLRVNHTISSQMLGHSDRLAIALRRMHDLAIEAPAALVLGALVLAQTKSVRARVFAIAGLVPLVAQVIDGHEQTVYPPRLVGPLLIALVPLAAIGLARARTATALLATLVPLAIVPFAQPSLVDESSVAFGRALRAHRFDEALAGGALLVEREARRPPFGWASVAVLWPEWPRLVFGTHRGTQWEMSDAANVRAGHVFIDDAALSSWLVRRGVRGAWALSPGARASVSHAWGAVRDVSVGDGTFVTTSSRPEASALENVR